MDWWNLFIMPALIGGIGGIVGALVVVLAFGSKE